jgi:ATP-dependent helicase HrpA
MTDGILLAEIQRDRRLRPTTRSSSTRPTSAASTSTSCSATSRQLLPRRPDLKVIITSATIDTARFSEHFDGAPVIEVEGRTHPVEVRYRPLDDARPRRPGRSTRSTGHLRRGRGAPPRGAGDMLVFLLRRARDPRHRRCARPSSTCPTPRSSRSTPGCRPPSSTGCSSPTAGGGSCSPPTSPRPRSPCPASASSSTPAPPGSPATATALKVQRLPIEPISQASANQRAGRCGRVGAGHLHPPLRRGRLRGPPRVHRPRDPPHQPRVGHPADGQPRPRRRGVVPVRRPARTATSATASRCSRSSAPSTPTWRAPRSG